MQCGQSRVTVFFVVAVLMLLALAAPRTGLATESILTDSVGRVALFNASHNLVTAQTNLLLPDSTWAHVPELGMGYVSAITSTITPALNRKDFYGTIEMSSVGTPGTCDYHKSIIDTPTGIQCQITVTPRASFSLAGIYFFFYVPVSDFIGGTATLHPPSGSDLTATIPVVPATVDPNQRFLRNDATRAVLKNAANTRTITLDFGSTYFVTIQDERFWGEQVYSVFLGFPNTAVTTVPNQDYTLSFTVSVSATSDLSPVNLAVDREQTRYVLGGFGGNFCENLPSQSTSYTLTGLNPAWARSEMRLADWQPTSQTLASDSDWSSLAAHDSPGSHLHESFLVARAIEARGVAHMSTVWRLPEWAYTSPGPGPSTAKRHIDPAQWDSILKCVGSYLNYAHQTYGIEPDLFSFNEPETGNVTVFTPNEYCDAVKRVGAHLSQSGWKTRVALGDTSTLGHMAFTTTTVSDPNARQYLGAVAAHVWGGTTPADFAACSDLASTLSLPLLLSEVGIDSRSRFSPAEIQNDLYGLVEARLYQDLLPNGRPSAFMHWDFTESQSLVTSTGPGPTQLTPTRRLGYLAQFFTATSHQSAALATTSDKPDVSITAFRKGKGYVIHVLNLGPARSATITGMAAYVQYRLFRTGETEIIHELPSITSAADGIHLSLATQSLLTLVSVVPPDPVVLIPSVIELY